MGSLIYILCPSRDILLKTQEKYKKFEWARPLLMPHLDNDIPIFENAAYTIIKSLEPEWIEKEYVGTLSYKFEEKILLEDVLSKIGEKKYDYVHFFVREDRSACNSGISCHGDDFEVAWNLLKENFSSKSYEIVECASNYWMCRPRFMLEFIKWHCRVVDFAKSNQVFHKEAFYCVGTLTTSELERIWGKPYYPLLPFVLERFCVMFFVHHKECFFEQNIILRNCPTCLLVCIGEREKDFVDIKHNSYPFLHNNSKFVFLHATPETELSALRETLLKYKDTTFDFTFIFSGKIRVACSWFRMMSALLSSKTPHSHLYYIGFCPLTHDLSKWSYDNLHVYSSCSKLNWLTCELSNVVYGGGIAFSHGNIFYDELLKTKGDGTLSHYLWERKGRTVGIFPQLVIPHVPSEMQTQVVKFCNSRFNSLEWYVKTLI
jgi:hypothetical protein